MNEYGINILLVEDDENLGYVIQDTLEGFKYNVSWSKDGESGLTNFLQNDFDICILDIMLPKMNGFNLAESIRSNNKKIPIIFLTAKNMKEDRIKGFMVGADDYITKPFSTEEFRLRIEAVLKRCFDIPSAADKKYLFSIGKYSFDFKNLKLSIAESEKNLTKKEADILRLFCENQNNVISRETMLKSIWGDDDYFTGRSMDVFITKLRKYLQKDPGIHIENVHGVGFKLVVD